jgi:hypothetical protein
VQFTSPTRRALGIFAAGTLGMSTAIIGIGGVAQATGPSPLTSSTTLTIPDGVCTVEWVLNGAAGTDVGSNTGGAGSHIVLHMSVTPGETLLAAPVTLTGGAAGAGGGAGGDGIGLNVDGNLEVAAAGGGGAGTWSAGGDAERAADGHNDGTYNYVGGEPGTTSAGGVGGVADTNDNAGVDGSNGVAQAGGAGGGVNSGGGGGGAFGGGGGASDSADGTGGGGGSNLIPDGSDADVTPATGATSLTYLFQNCTADEMPGAPTDLAAHGADGQLTIDFTPNWDSPVGPDTWQYRIGATGTWADFTPVDDGYGDMEYVLHGLTNGTPYQVFVRAVSSNSIPGPAASVTGTPFKPIGAPANVAYTVSGSVVTITWDAPTTTGTNALAGYQAFLFYNYGERGGPAFECDTAVTVHVCKAPAPPGPSYTGGVNAVDSEGNAGEPSQMLTIGKIAAPASVPASNGALTVPGGGAGSGATGEVVKGHDVKLHGTGYMPNSLVSVIIYSTPQVLTAVQTDASGSFDVTVTVPAGLANGHHTLVAAGVDPSGQTRYMNLAITVTAGKAELAYTGASIVGPGIAGLLALVVGSGLLMVSRRRRTA